MQLSQLTKALSQLNPLDKYENTFDVDGVSVTLRPLTSIQEMEVQKRSSEIFEDVEGETREALAVEYIERFKLFCLSFSIVQIGDLDLRNVEYIETGEKTNKGKKIRIKKVKAIYGIVSQWARPTTATMFRKFGEMIEKMEIDSENAIIFDPPDLDIEIERLNVRIEAMERLKEQRSLGEREPYLNVDKTQQTKVDEDDDEYEDMDDYQAAEPTVATMDFDGDGSNYQNEYVEKEPEDLAPKTSNIQNSQVRESVIPNSVTAAPISRTVPIQESTEIQEEIVESSHVDSSAEANVESQDSADPLGEEAMQAEHQRMMQMRARRKPPHLNARNANHQVQRQKPVQEGSMKVGGEEVPVFRMPAQNLSNRPAKATNKKGGQDPTANPNYRPRRKR